MEQYKDLGHQAAPSGPVPSALTVDAPRVETKTYADGTTATGPAPLPAQSPAQQDERVMGMIEDYGQWLWDAGYFDSPTGETLVDAAAERRKEIRAVIGALQQDAYAEGRKDQSDEDGELLRWAYSKLHHVSFTKQDDALMPDRFKLLLEHGVSA